MIGERDGVVCIRNEVLFVESSRVHLSRGSEHEVSARDLVLLDLVQSGEGDLGRLCAAVQRLAGREFDVAAELRSVLEDPRSILELVPHFDVAEPDVIVCCFSGPQAPPWVGPLVRRLRRRRSVLFLGSASAVRGPHPQNFSFEGSLARERHGDWYQFIQWVRGTLLRFEGTPLVLCGMIDAILFGDLAPYFRTLSITDPGWPARVGLLDLCGKDWVPGSLVDERRELYYALRFGDGGDLLRFSRGAVSAFAVLEAHALRFSRRVVATAADHRGELLRLGLDEDAIALGHPYAASTGRGTGAGPAAPDVVPDVIVVLGGEGSVDAVAPVLRTLESIPADARVHRDVAVRIGPAWLRWRVDGSTASVVPWEGPPPASERILAVLVPIGLHRDLLPVWRTLASPAPCWIVPSSRPHPIQVSAPAELVLNPCSATLLATRLRAVAERDGAGRRRDLRRQRRLLRDHDVAALVAELALEHDEERRRPAPAERRP